jgi:hypothetical protein
MSIDRLKVFDKAPVITPFIEASLMSWKGYSIHADAYALTRQLHESHPAMQVAALGKYID